MNNLGLLLIKASREWKEGVNNSILPFGLTLSPYLLLKAIYTLQFDEGYSPSQRDAADLAGLDLNVTSQAMKYLQQHHLVNRELSENDGRAYALTLTLAGQQLAKQTSTVVETFETEFFKALKSDAFAGALRTLLKA